MSVRGDLKAPSFSPLPSLLSVLSIVPSISEILLSFAGLRSIVPIAVPEAELNVGGQAPHPEREELFDRERATEI
jgi:hypothetical protein